MRGSDFDWIVSSLSATVCDTLVQRCHICEKRSKVCAPGSFGMMAFLCAGVGQNALVERKRMHVDSGSTQCPLPWQDMKVTVRRQLRRMHLGIAWHFMR
jgi:hypothetical protein